ncbi:MAG: family 20 glycosylhydrolase [Clostridia bacterium]|nr:family 20 glycosylhydrolase [Clostridia bacterium]MBQ8469540.1 family 20 glycosylhydrolase [Clostridia bacterium]MBR1704758.1 family 20 glycosylhydrolase [Clostridia bacterium]
MLNVLPKINGPVRKREGTFSFPETIIADLGGFEAYCLTAFAERTGLSLQEAVPESNATPWVYLNRIETEKPSEYHLTVGEEGVTVEAATEEGIICALTTLFQLSDFNDADWCSMTDEPRWETRGLALDCARSFISVEELKKILEQMSLAKLNVFQWKLTDDQAWRLEVVRAPKLHENSSGGKYYTRDDVKEVVAFAKTRGIEVIPQIELPGHVTALLHAYPQYSCYNDRVELPEAGGLYAPILCAGFEGTYDFIDRLLEEVTTLFPSDKFHVGGGTAVHTDWETCPVCKTKMEKEGLAETEELTGYFFRRVSELLKKYEKNAVFYNDALEAGNAPTDGTVQFWTSNYADSMLDYADEGHAYVYSDVFELHLDFPHSMIPLQRVYETEPHIGRFVCADDPNLKGLIAEVSTMHIKDNGSLEQNLFPRTYAVAEVGWAGPGKDYEEFLSRLRPLMYKTRKGGCQCTPERWWDPKGARRRDDALSFYRSMTDGIPEDVQKQTRKAFRPTLEYRRQVATNFFRPSDLPAALGNLLPGSRK